MRERICQVLSLTPLISKIREIKQTNTVTNCFVKGEYSMNELRYQLDLLKAMNQKLSSREKMYAMLCETTSQAFIYFPLVKNEVVLLGKWDSFFDFTIKEPRDIALLFDAVEETCILPLRDVLFLEKSGGKEACAQCRLKNRKLWLEFRTFVTYGENGVASEKMISITDITKSKAQNEELKYMAYYDSLTGLFNRNYFVSLLSDYLDRAAGEEAVVSVLIIDIDDFRKINDGMGIIVGDELVQQFGACLKELCTENAICCHLNGDVYAMAIYSPSGSLSVEHIHRAIRNRTREPFRLSSGQELTITVSIGVAEYPEAAVTALELLNCAEIVMFKSKSMGKNAIQYFDDSILKEFLHNVAVESRLKEAVYDRDFEMYYQPQFFAGNRRLRGLEALIRWKGVKGNMLSPSVFIPAAERSGAIIPIGNWVMEQSISQYARWKHAYGCSFIMSINISAIQYKRADFEERLIQILHKYQVHPSEEELEITESVLIEDFEAVLDKMNRLREKGVRFSLDDFGTGYSSLSYLKRLPIDTLKIDKSFIDTVLQDSSTRVITESIIHMVNTLGMESIAEGVERDQQYEYLHAIGCDVIQGYLLGRPQPAQEIEKML